MMARPRLTYDDLSSIINSGNFDLLQPFVAEIIKTCEHDLWDDDFNEQ